MGAPDGHNSAAWGGPDPPDGERSRLDRALSDLTDDARRDAARVSRIERQDREMAAGLSATFLGTLVEACESRTPVVLVTVGGGNHRGLVTMVGADVVVVSTGIDGRRSLLALFAIDAVRQVGAGHGRAVDSLEGGPSMAELLDDLAVDRRLAVGTVGGNRFMGRMLRVGVDQLTLRLDGEHDVLTIPLSAIAEVVIEP